MVGAMLVAPDCNCREPPQRSQAEKNTPGPPPRRFRLLKNSFRAPEARGFNPADALKINNRKYKVPPARLRSALPPWPSTSFFSILPSDIWTTVG